MASTERFSTWLLVDRSTCSTPPSGRVPQPAIGAQAPFNPWQTRACFPGCSLHTPLSVSITNLASHSAPPAAFPLIKELHQGHPKLFPDNLQSAVWVAGTPSSLGIGSPCRPISGAPRPATRHSAIQRTSGPTKSVIQLDTAKYKTYESFSTRYSVI